MTTTSLIGGRLSSAQLSTSHALYHIPYHKADCFYMGTMILHTRHDIACPVHLLHDYIKECDKCHRAHPTLFLRKDGAIPTQTWFDKRFFVVLNQSYGGHWAHAGGATYYVNLGLPEEIIQALGCWSSMAWKDYICENPTIWAELELLCLQQQLLTM